MQTGGPVTLFGTNRKSRDDAVIEVVLAAGTTKKFDDVWISRI